MISNILFSRRNIMPLHTRTHVLFNFKNRIFRTRNREKSSHITCRCFPITNSTSQRKIIPLFICINSPILNISFRERNGATTYEIKYVLLIQPLVFRREFVLQYISLYYVVLLENQNFRAKNYTTSALLMFA